MTGNPFINALSASAYIALVVFGIHFGSKLVEGQDETLLAPMAFLSLFVLSAAVMGYVFLKEPLILFLEGKREEGVRLFLKTVCIFALLTVAVFGVVLGFTV